MKLPLIQCLHLSMRYDGGHHDVLRDITLEAHRGDFILVVGPAGSGKSTLLKIMAGLESFQQGNLLVDGRSVRHMSSQELLRMRRRTGYATPDSPLVSHESVWDNVAVPLEITGRDPLFIQAKVRRILRAAGLEHAASKPASRLSIVERRRTMLARAIVHDPQLLLADEPLESLDKASAEEVFALLKTAHTMGSTVVMASHDGSTPAGFMPTCTYFLDGGSIKPGDRNTSSR